MVDRTGLHEKPRIAAIGCGQWGKNIVRNLAELGVLAAVCDANPNTARDMAKRYDVPATGLAEIMADAAIGAVAIASPAAMHIEHARLALKAGKDVFVEKPLALTVGEGRELADLARRGARILMVGHLLQYHPMMLKLFEIVRNGELGEIRHVVSNRLSHGRIRDNEDVMWSFAPHDISSILSIFGQMPRSVFARTSRVVSRNLADMADIELAFAGGAGAHIFVSWLNADRERTLKVTGTRAEAIFDDLLPWKEKLKLRRYRVDTSGGQPALKSDAAIALDAEEREPLQEECRHFIEAIARRRAPRTNGAEAMRVLSVLEAATQSAQSGALVAPAPVQEHP